MDSHMYEQRDMWSRYMVNKDRENAMAIVDDELGYPMLRYKGRSPRGTYCWMGKPGFDENLLNLDAFMGQPQRDQRDGIPAKMRYEDLPLSYTDAGARVVEMDRQGVGESFVFPQWGLETEGTFFRDDLEGFRLNLESWNRYCADMVIDSGGRLHPVAHLSLQGDQSWVVDQIRAVARAGMKLAFFSADLINGKRLSHPENAPIWQAFIENDVTATFHINIGSKFIPFAWIDNDHETFSAIGMSWLNMPPMLALSDLTLNGTLEDFPDLRVCVVELRAPTWLGDWMAGMDRVYRSQPKMAGWNVRTLKNLPSDYIKRQVRFGALVEDPVANAITTCGNLFGFGGDWPHPEGVDNPLKDFAEIVQFGEDSEAATAFWGGNAAWALGRTQAHPSQPAAARPMERV
ncbi:amidohydrolase family protein [Sphingobium herbicidovorans]|nr:amidohydrolase family protein [Sphingobium herbicidovorans]